MFQIGNTAGIQGRRNEKLYRDALRRAVALAAKDGEEGMLRVAKAHVKRCLTGDMAAINAFADRMDGKVPQAIDVNDENAALSHREWLGWVISEGVRMREALEAQVVAPSLPQLELKAEKPNDINKDELLTKQSDTPAS